ncbi:unnamed protein product [Ectocarpus sp. 8 AP-2014]
MSCQFIENAARHYINRQPLFGPTNREAYTHRRIILCGKERQSRKFRKNKTHQEPTVSHYFPLYKLSHIVIRRSCSRRDSAIPFCDQQGKSTRNMKHLAWSVQPATKNKIVLQTKINKVTISSLQKENKNCLEEANVQTATPN